MTARKTQLMRVGSVFIGVLVLDQVSKALIRLYIELDAPARADVFFQFVHHRNPGIVGGAFRSVPLLPYAAPVVAFAILIYLFRHLSVDSRWQSAAYGMILAGAIGNFTDRIVYGGVTDFIQIHFLFIPFEFPWKNYPAFNIADSGIMVGVGLLLVTWNAGEGDDATRTV